MAPASSSPVDSQPSAPASTATTSSASSSSASSPSSSSASSAAPPPAATTTSSPNAPTAAASSTSSDALSPLLSSANSDAPLSTSSSSDASTDTTTASASSSSSSSSSSSNSTTVLIVAMFAVAIVGAIIGIIWFKYRNAKRSRNAARYGRGVGFERDDAVSYGNISPHNAASVIGGAAEGRRNSAAIDRQQYYSELFVRGQQQANINPNAGIRRGSTPLSSEQLLLQGNSAAVSTNVGGYGAFGGR
ncbi:hypothetical protein HDU84_001712 [Entophlyctis sp. JEL0112]|nr:hypothetical protein HDU84_001712 [Entophlyctis sp. JEL0112]